MSKNIGSIDRLLRVVAALALAVLVLAKVVTGTWAVVLGVLAVVFVLTAALGFCPLYCPLKLSTTQKPKA